MASVTTVDRVSQHKTRPARPRLTQRSPRATPRPRPFFWSKTGLVLRPTVSDHVTANTERWLDQSVVCAGCCSWGAWHCSRPQQKQLHGTYTTWWWWTEFAFEIHKLYAGGRHNVPPRPCKLTFDLLNLKVVSESRVTSVTYVQFQSSCHVAPDSQPTFNSTTHTYSQGRRSHRSWGSRPPLYEAKGDGGTKLTLKTQR